MSKSTYVALTAVFVLAGCTSGVRSPSSSPAPRTAASPSSSAPTLPACLAGTDARAVSVRNGPTIFEEGSGTTAVVFSNESDEDLCSWHGFASSLAGANATVALYDYTADPVADLTAVARTLRAAGAGALVLAGASEGAKASIVAAATLHPNAVVSLSAESALQGEPVAPYARRLTAPTVFATAADDPYGATAATRGFYRSAPADHKRLLVEPGTAHGTALLTNSTVRKAIAALIAAVPAGSTSFQCGRGATKLALTGSGGFRIAGLALGAGPVTALFLHELGMTADVCGFWPYASWLSVHYGVRAVLVDRCGVGGSRCPAATGDRLIAGEVGPAVAWARSHGARRVVLVGASAGGGDALEAAGVLPGVDAVVDLSGDITSTRFSVQQAAARVRVPTLMAVATGDDICPLPAFRRQYAAVPAATKRLVVVADPLGRHGWDLVGSLGTELQQLAPRVADWIEGQYG